MPTTLLKGMRVKLTYRMDYVHVDARTNSHMWGTAVSRPGPGVWACRACQRHALTCLHI